MLAMGEENEIVCRSLRHLDALVAEHVTQLEAQYVANGYPKGCLKRNPGAIPHYTTWPGLEPVIRNREEAGYFWEFYQESDALMRKAWTVGLVILDSMGDRELVASGHHNTAPTAACIAALASARCRVRLELGEE